MLVSLNLQKMRVFIQKLYQKGYLAFSVIYYGRNKVISARELRELLKRPCYAGFVIPHLLFLKSKRSNECFTMSSLHP